MAEIGSFALLLALALSLYSFLAGILALAYQKQAIPVSGGSAAHLDARSEVSLAALLRRSSERIGETARRAGARTARTGARRPGPPAG